MIALDSAQGAKRRREELEAECRKKKSSSGNHHATDAFSRAGKLPLSDAVWWDQSTGRGKAEDAESTRLQLASLKHQLTVRDSTSQHRGSDDLAKMIDREKAISLQIWRIEPLVDRANGAFSEAYVTSSDASSEVSVLPRNAKPTDPKLAEIKKLFSVTSQKIAVGVQNFDRAKPELARLSQLTAK